MPPSPPSRSKPVISSIVLATWLLKIVFAIVEIIVVIVIVIVILEIVVLGLQIRILVIFIAFL